LPNINIALSIKLNLVPQHIKKHFNSELLIQEAKAKKHTEIKAAVSYDTAAFANN